jgi:membrane protease YdiL (CAAX protease family)
LQNGQIVLQEEEILMTTDIFETVRAGNVYAPQPDRKEQFLELSTFLFLIVPSMALSYLIKQEDNLSFRLSAIASILRDLALVGLILFFLWRNREAVRSIGWTPRNVWKEVLLGVSLFFPLFYISGYLENALHAAGLSLPSAPQPSFLFPKGPVEVALALIMVLVVAIAEETIFRGYLILRFRVMMSNVAAVLLSIAVFALGHGYEGTAGLVTVAFMGLVFTLVYQWRQSLVAPMVMHFLQDFAVIVLPPLLAMIH